MKVHMQLLPRLWHKELKAAVTAVVRGRSCLTHANTCHFTCVHPQTHFVFNGFR